MTASYPSSVRSYKAVVDLVDTVIADNVNSLQEEIKALETTLGSATTNQNPLASTWTGSFSTATTWGTVYDRLANIEAGLTSGVANAPYVLTAGGSSITTTTNKGLQLKAGVSSLNLLEAYAYGNTLNFNLDASGLPKVGANNVIYVNSTEYNSLVSATSAASTLAGTKVSATNGAVTTASTSSGVVRNIYVNTVVPSTTAGYLDGDIWVVYA